MGKPRVTTITNPVDLLLAQLSEIRAGNTATRKEIERLRRLLLDAQKEEARLETELSNLLEKYRQDSSTVSTTAGTGD